MVGEAATGELSNCGRNGGQSERASKLARCIQLESQAKVPFCGGEFDNAWCRELCMELSKVVGKP